MCFLFRHTQGWNHRYNPHSPLWNTNERAKGDLKYTGLCVSLTRGHPRFGNIDPVIPVDVIRVKSDVGGLDDSYTR